MRRMRKWLAGLIVGVGVATALLNDWGYATYSSLARSSGDHSLDLGTDVAAAVPFLVIAFVVARRPITLAAGIVATVLVVATLSYRYFVAWTDSSSLSVLAIFVG